MRTNTFMKTGQCCLMKPCSPVRISINTMTEIRITVQYFLPLFVRVHARAVRAHALRAGFSAPADASTLLCESLLRPIMLPPCCS